MYIPEHYFEVIVIFSDSTNFGVTFLFGVIFTFFFCGFKNLKFHSSSKSWLGFTRFVSGSCLINLCDLHASLKCDSWKHSKKEFQALYISRVGRNFAKAKIIFIDISLQLIMPVFDLEMPGFNYSVARCTNQNLTKMAFKFKVWILQI